MATWSAPSGTVGSAHYLYDQQGNRVLTNSSNASSTTDTIYFDGYTETVLSAGTTTTTKYDSANGTRIAVRVGGATLDYLLSDPLGSNSVALNDTGQVIGLEHYSPYGTVDSQWGSMPTSFNYAGERLDSQTGLLYDTFRSYDPLSGRFVRADNVQDNSTGMDPYAYVGDDPESRNDPSGHKYILPSGGGGVSSAPSPQSIDTWCLQNTDCNQALANYQDEIFVQTLQDAQSWLFLALGLIPSIAETMEGNPEAFQAEEQEFEQLTGESPEDQFLGEPCSFTPTTTVQTAHGKQAIGEIHVGEKVLAYNSQTHKMELKPVLHVWTHQDNDLVDLTITTANPHSQSKESEKKAFRTSEVVHTNKQHPFFTTEKGFLPVGQIKVGMHIQRADGRIGIVTKWQLVPGMQTMYNLEVAQDHTFTVGDGEWIVHNCTPSAFDSAMREAYASMDVHNQLAAKAGLALQKAGIPIVKFLTKLNSDGSFPGDGSGGEIDLETPNMIVEVKSGVTLTGQMDQITELQTDPIRNPDSKPVIIYAPGITNTNAINNILAHGAYYASNPQQLIELQYYLQAGKPLG